MSFFREFLSGNLPELVNGGRIGEIRSHVIMGVTGYRKDLPAPFKTPVLFISPIPTQTRKTLCLPIDAISGYFRPRYTPLQPEWRKNWRNCKTIMSFFREFMSGNLPELVNGGRIGEIRSHVIMGVTGYRKDLPAPLKPPVLSFPKYPHRPGKRYTLQLMLLAVISGHDIPLFNRNGGRIGGIAKQ